MKTDLRAFLRCLARKPFSYGDDGTDCGRPLADLWAAEHGVDPAACIRRAYADRAGCMAVLAGQALPRLVARLAREHGARRSQAPYRPGDMAVLRIGKLWFGAIRDDDGFWIVKESDGVLAMREAHVVAAWSL